MTHSGVALMVIVAFGLGAFLYYMFADNPNNDQQHQYGNDDSSPPEPPDPWNTSPDSRYRRRTTGDRPRRRRRHPGAGKVSCTICLAELPETDYMQLYPCRHEFHKTCIANWREQGPLEARNTCPNCRVPITTNFVI